MLRSSRRASGPGNLPSGGPAGGSGDWLTVREASEATGIPTSTIRKWARHDNIPSFLEETSNGYLRLVSMEGIAQWTDEIGRDVDAPHPETVAEVDLTSGKESEGGGGEPAEQTVPEGSMIIPLDAWNRMLNQLGNLHEAGQQLAEARERAAKAETEARFLKERLADLREELKETRAASADPDEPDSTRMDRTSEKSPMSIVKKAYVGWRSKRRTS